MIRTVISKSTILNHLRTASSSAPNNRTPWKKKGNIHEEEYIRQQEKLRKKKENKDNENKDKENKESGS